MSEKKYSAKDRNYFDACNGDADARSALFSRVSPKLFFASEMYTQDPSLAEETVREFFEHAYEEPKKNHRVFETDALRSVLEASVSKVPYEFPELSEDLPVLPAPEDDPEEIDLEPFEKDIILRNVFSALELPFREALLMRYLEKLSPKKIAVLKHIPEDSAELLVKDAEVRAAYEMSLSGADCFGRTPLQFFADLMEEKRTGRLPKKKVPGKVIVFDLPEEEVKPVSDQKIERTVQNAEKERAQKVLSYARRITLLFTVIVLCLCAIPVRFAMIKAEEKKKEIAHEKALQSLQISFVTEDGEEIQNFEYGAQAVQARSLVESHTGNLEILGDAYIDPSSLTPYETVYRLSTEDEYGEPVSWDVVRHYSVSDTTGPVIVLKSTAVELFSTGSYDPKSNIDSVTDEVDGHLEYAEKEPEALSEDAWGRIYENGWYTVTGNVNPSAKGTYSVKVTASDKHGNRTEESYTVVVSLLWEGARDTSITTGYQAANKTYLYNYLTGTVGLTRAAACGVLANCCQESWFRPEAYDNYYGQDYRGICQWGGGRLEGLYSFCERNGYDWETIEGQAAYIGYELQGTYSFVLRQMMACPNTAQGAYDAAEIFRSQYEVSAYKSKISATAAAYFINE